MPPGTIKDGGILPRSLALIFNSLQGQLHPTPDLKPLLSNEVIWLDSKQIRQEEMKKLSLLNGGLQEVKHWYPWQWGQGVQISGKFCAYLLPVPLQEELSTSLKRSVYIESRIGTSTSFDSGIAGLSSISQCTSSSQLDGMYHDWALPRNSRNSLPVPNSCQEYRPEVAIWGVPSKAPAGQKRDELL